MLKALNDENKDAEILQHIGVSKDGEAVEEDKMTRDERLVQISQSSLDTAW